MSAAEAWIHDLVDAVEIDDEVVYAAVTVDLDVDSVVTVRRRHASTDRPQGLVLDADTPLLVGQTASPRLVVWSDTAPDEVTIHAPAGRLSVWNVWRDDGAVHAWIGEAGIRREPLDVDGHDAAARLLASDGHPGSGVDLDVDLLIDAS